MMDLDKFKKINDTFGHQVGDKVIINVAKIINENLKGEEYGARLGGDEYIFVLAERFHPETVKSAISNILEGVHSIQLKDNTFVSGSIGVISVSSGELIFDNMYRSADNALYKAKADGRNQIVFGKYKV